MRVLYNHTTIHKFTDWDRLDREISTVAKHYINGKPVLFFDILAWKFLDSDYWHDICVIPVGALIAVKWVVGCKVEAVDPVDPSCTQPHLNSTASTASTASTLQPSGVM